MLPMKAMPILLTVFAPFGVTAGDAAAAETPVIAKAPVIFAQFDLKKDELKNSRGSGQQQPSRPQSPPPSSQPRAAPPPQPRVSAPPPPPPASHFQRSQGTSPDTVKSHGSVTAPGGVKLQGSVSPQGGPKVQGSFTAPGGNKLQGSVTPQGGPKVQGSVTAPGGNKLQGSVTPQGGVKVQGSVTAPGGNKLQGSVTPQGGAKVQGSVTAPGGNKLQGSVTPQGGPKVQGSVTAPGAVKLEGSVTPQGGAKLHGPGASPDTVKLHQPHQPNTLLHRELSAEEKQAKAGREAHAADRARLIEQQKLMASHEKSQSAVSERLRIQNERMQAISSQRQHSVDSHGQNVIKEPGNRTIFKAGGRAFVHHDETANFHAYGGIPQTRRGSNGNAISTIVRHDGVRIEVEVDGHGRPLRRVRHLPDGRRFVLFENRALAIGAAIAVGALIVSLPPVEVDIPREQYIVDAGEASEDDIYGALQAGPLVALDRAYSLEEVLASVSLRERMRSINIDSINFDFGSADVPRDQAEMLESVAAVMRDMINRNPGEVFLIEGHTDAVGSDDDNLSLSDRRAQSVAEVLSQQFNIPRENLVTQGYGEQFLLVPAQEPERRNRRVVVRRLTPLLQSDGQYSASDGPSDR